MSESAVSVRPAATADAAVITAFNAALAEESEGLALDPATLDAGVRACLADPAKGFYTLAEVGGEVVGQLLVTFEWSDWRNGFFWWVQSVYVAPHARRLGVFRTLYRQTEAQARATPDVIGVRLYVEDDNHRAQATYAALGLTREPYRVMGKYPL